MDKVQLDAVPPASGSEQLEDAAGKCAPTEAELRRQMYERIARGNALAEVEQKASRWS